MTQRTTERTLAFWLSFLVLLCAAWSPTYAQASSEPAGTGSALEGGAPIVPAVQPLIENQGYATAQVVTQLSPEAVLAREESLTKYEGLSDQAAVKLAGEAFPAGIKEADGGVPKLAAGQSVIGFPAVDAALVDLGGGRRGVLDSLAPLAVEVGPDRRVPVDLGLSQAGTGFEPRVPVVGVRIGKRVAGGVVLPVTGISVTPVDSQGVALGGGEGVIEGASVVYPNVQKDETVAVKASTFGFDVSAILQASDSPRTLFYRVGLPAGATLVATNDGSGEIQVVEQGEVIATIAAPAAEDATGAPVPVSMTVSGSTLVVSVNASATTFQYPIRVDPSVVTDKELDLAPGNWVFHTTATESFFSTPTSGQKLTTIRDSDGGKGHPYTAGKIGYFEYPTQGESEIYGFIATFREANLGPKLSVRDRLALREKTGGKELGTGEGGWAEITEPPMPHTELTRSEVKICARTECAPYSKVEIKAKGNDALFEQEAIETETGENLWYAELKSASVEIEQETAPTASFDTSDATIEGKPNALLSGVWYSAKAGVEFGLNARDYGVGLNKEGLSSPSKSGWGFIFQKEARNECEGAQCNECYEPACLGKGSGNGKSLSYALQSAAGGELPDGEDTIEGKVEDGVGLNHTATATMKVDSSPPHGISLSGLPSTHELRDGQHIALKASATDGEAPTPSSGIASIVLQIDGQQIGGAQGSCSSGPCSGSAEWTLSGENYAAGQHTLTVVATDKAGNVASEEYKVTIHHPETVAVGPGGVNPVTGELSMASTDVSIGVPNGTLNVGRSYRSEHLAQGSEGPLGPQWTMSLGAEQSLVRVTGGMVLTSETGSQIVFANNGEGGFTAPTGDAGLVLKEKSTEKGIVFTLGENGSVTTFEIPSGGGGNLWMPASIEGPNGTGTTLYKYKVSGGVIEPSEELAPVPAGVSCGKELSELKEGCRALKFEYANETKAKGEKESDWGSFNGHLAEVIYIAWNSSKVKTETKVAEYTYDNKGKLRAVWDPRVTPPLKTTYGYDSEGHVTAVSGPGHEPSLLQYGTAPDDSTPGRLLAVSIPSASTALGSGEAPVNTTVPVLSSTTPAVGTKISVNLVGEEETPGKWEASPLAFIYQWEDCNSAGSECTPIPGAVNQAYYPVSSDEGHRLVAEAVALNATGATVASSLATSSVASGTPNTPLPEPPVVGGNSVTTLEYQVPVSGAGAPYPMGASEVAEWGQSTDLPNEAMAVFPPDKVMGWPAKKYEREMVYYLDQKDRTVNVANPYGGIATSEYNSYNDIVRTLTADNRKKALEETGKTIEASKSLDTEYRYREEGSEPGVELLSMLGPQHSVKLAIGKEGKHNEEAVAREHTTYAYNEGAPSKGGPYHLVTKMIDGAETATKEEFDQRTTETSYSGQGGLGWELRKPTSVITDPSGLDLVHTTEYNSLTGDVIETKMPAANGKDTKVAPAYKSAFGSKGAGAGQFNGPNGATVDSSQHVWVTDYTNNRVEEFSNTGSFIRAIGFGVSNGEAKFQICTSGCKAGIAGSGEGQFSGPAGISYQSGGIYVTDYNNNRIEKFNESGEYAGQFGAIGVGAGQMKGPVSITISSAGDAWIGDLGNNRVDEFTTSGTFIETIGFGVTNGEAKFEICSAGCKAGIAGSGNGQFSSVQGDAVSGTNLYVADLGNNRIEQFNEKGEYLSKFGTKGKGNGEFELPTGMAANPTNGNIYVTDWNNGRVQEFAATGSYLTQFGTKGTGTGQFSGPEGIVVNASQDVYVVDNGDNRVEEWAPSITGNEGAHNVKTIYYTKESNTEYPSCGGHPEMANLVCETSSVAQPGTSGLPELPTVKYAYNAWNEIETVTETVGSSTRTKTNTYDAAGRLKIATASSTEGTSLSPITYEYSTTTGALLRQCLNAGKPCTEGSPKTIAMVDNTLGQLTSYTDADENTTSYEYDLGGRPTKINDGKGTQTITYSTTTGLPTEVLDSSHEGMKFTGTYDVEANLLTEGYPNGMVATYTYNATGKPIKLVYKKTTHCVEEAEKCKWLKDTVLPSIHGQWIEQTGTLSKQVYAYDSAGRLTEVKNTPVGQGCTVRIYAYDEDTNRTSLTTRAPGTEGKCATEGGTIESHTYDTADRLTDTGINYNAFGDITNVPAQGSEDPELTNAYYADGQAASQKQSKQTIGYNLDPARRTRETVATGEPTNADTILHYADPSDSPSWINNPTSGEWSRNIAGINGGLVAIQSNAETPELELTNLHGDIIAKAYLSETATELAAKTDTSEYGVPTVNAPAKYAWLGAIELPTELPSGVVTMGIRSYIPQLGRFLQPDPVNGGSANAYSYTFGDPVNSDDPTGAYAATASAAVAEALSAEAEIGAAMRQAAAETAARAQAENAALQAQWAAEAAAGPQYNEEEWEEYWEEEEYEYEYEYSRYSPESEKGEIGSGIFYEMPWSHASITGEGDNLVTISTCDADTEVVQAGGRYSDIAMQCPVQSKRGGPGKTPTGPRRPPKDRRPGKRQPGKGPYRKRPPGTKGPWPPRKSNQNECQEENERGELCL